MATTMHMMIAIVTKYYVEKQQTTTKCHVRMTLGMLIRSTEEKGVSK